MLAGQVSTETLNQVVAIDNSEMEYCWSLDSWRDFISTNNFQMLLSKDGGELVGFCLYLVNKYDMSAHLIKVATAKNFKRQGRAYQMLEQSILSFRLNSFESIFLEVEENNNKAVNLYRKLGFRKLNLIKKFYTNGKNAYAMLLDLNS